jgi:hypothetical protein
MYKLANKENGLIFTVARIARGIENDLNIFVGRDDGLSFSTVRAPGGFAIVCHSTVKAGPPLGWVSETLFA